MVRLGDPRGAVAKPELEVDRKWSAAVVGETDQRRSGGATQRLASFNADVDVMHAARLRDAETTVQRTLVYTHTHTHTLFITSPPAPVRSIAMSAFVCLSVCPLAYLNKNSSGDEIANVNVYAVRPEATRIR